MRERTMDEMIKYFNDTVSAMDISRKDKMTILGMIVAIGYKHQDECKTYQEIIETDRAEIDWLKKCVNDLPKADVVSGRDFRDCRNELCLKCGAYTERHNGACDGCRWRG